MLSRIPEGHKQCVSCSSVQPRAEFHDRKGAKDGKEGRCKGCHRESARLTMRRRYEREPERVRANVARWKAANIEQVRAKARVDSLRWAKENPDKSAAKAVNRRAARRAALVDPHVDVAWLRARDGDACHYCGTELAFAGAAGNRAELEHKMPLSRGGFHSEDNCVLACRDCNRQKFTKTAEEFNAYRQSNSAAVTDS